MGSNHKGKGVHSKKGVTRVSRPSVVNLLSPSQLPNKPRNFSETNTPSSLLSPTPKINNQHRKKKGRKGVAAAPSSFLPPSLFFILFFSLYLPIPLTGSIRCWTIESCSFGSSGRFCVLCLRGPSMPFGRFPQSTRTLEVSCMRSCAPVQRPDRSLT